MVNFKHGKMEIFNMDHVECLFSGCEVIFNEACFICSNSKEQLADFHTKKKATLATKAMVNVIGKFKKHIQNLFIESSMKNCLFKNI